MNLSIQEARRQNCGAEMKPLQVIGQDMHILNPAFCRAVEEKDRHALAALALRQAEAGADALDLNLGPARKNRELLDWAVEVVREAAGLPLFAASQILAMPELLRRHQGWITVNSVTADPATLPANMEQAQQCGAELVVLLVRPGLTPYSAEERLLIAAEVLDAAARTGFPPAKLYLDPLFHPNPDPVRQGMPDIDPVLETLAGLPLISREKTRTLLALSTASAFLPETRRPALHHRLLPLLAAAGLDAVILGCHDQELMTAARHPGMPGCGLSPGAHLAGVYMDKV